MMVFGSIPTCVNELYYLAKQILALSSAAQNKCFELKWKLEGSVLKLGSLFFTLLTGKVAKLFFYFFPFKKLK